MSAIGLVLVTIGVVARDRPRGDRALLAAGLRARRDRLADRSGRRHGDHASARRPAPAREHRRGRKPRERCERARGLPGGRGRRGGRELLGARCTADFAGAVAGGIAIGLGTGWVVAQIRRRVDDPTTGSTISLLTGLRRVPARRGARRLRRSRGRHRRPLHGLAGARDRLARGALAERRHVGGADVFLLNAALFILIGLQLPVIIDGLDTYTTGEAIGYSALICATVIGTRFLWHLHHAVCPPGARPPARAAGAPGRRRAAHRDRLGWDARSRLARRRAGAATRDGCRRRAARTRPDPVHHLRADPRSRSSSRG